MKTTNNKITKEMIEKMQEQEKPKIIKNLELGKGEIYLGELTNKDKYQVLVRHLQVLENYNKLSTQFLSMMTICLQELCKKQGIDIDKIINGK